MHTAVTSMWGCSLVAPRLTVPTGMHEEEGSVPGLAQWINDPVWPGAVVQVKDVTWIPSCCDGCRLAAVALIRPLAWELPYTTGAAIYIYIYKITGMSSRCGSVVNESD